MNWMDLLRMSSGNLKRRKLRTFLTVLGVIIGTTSIVVMISLGLGMQKEIYKEINDSRFLFIDRSCFVNIDHVTCFADAEVKLDNQESLPISHSNFTAIRSVLLYKTPNEIQQPVR